MTALPDVLNVLVLARTADRNLERIRAIAPDMGIKPIDRKWESFGWHVITVNGHDVAQVLEALDAAEQVKGYPTVIVADTVKGKDISFAEHNAAFHNGILTEEQYQQAMADIDARRAELEKD